MRKTFALMIVVYSAILLAVIELSGCSSLEKKVAANYYLLHKDQLAETCQQNFPQTPVYIEGKDSIRVDTTTVYETHFITDRDTNVIVNKITPVKYRTITITKLRVDTLKLPDNAKIFALQTAQANLQDKLNQTITAYQKAHKLLWWVIGLAALCLTETYVLIRNVSIIQFIKSFFV